MYAENNFPQYAESSYIDHLTNGKAMKTKSFSTSNIDPYEAGMEIGQAFKDIKPEAIIMFASVNYADFSELYEGIYDELGNKDVIIFGGTGDGYYESDRVENVGVGALAFNSQGKVEWTVDVEAGLAEDSFRTGQACAQKIKNAAADEIKLAFVMAGMSGDGAKMTAGIRTEFSAPCVGGLTGDDRHFQHGIVLVNGRMHEDAIGILALSGDVQFAMNLASGWAPVGEIATVEEAEGNRIFKIDGMSTVDFIHKQFGKPPSEVDITTLSMAAYQQPECETYVMRTPFKMDEDGSLTYFGSVEEGTPVRVCTATREEVLGGVSEALQGLPELDFDPSAALIISCAGRKWVLGERTKEELERTSSELKPTLPLLGLPSFGEIAPHKNEDGTYTGTYFHNVTFIILLLGGSK